MTWQDRLGPFGVWRRGTLVSAAEAQEVERLGFGAIWIGGSPAADLRHTEDLLAATERVVLATGIVNIWTADAEELGASFLRIEERFPGRLLLGIGTGHREATAERTRPLDAMQRYLDVLDLAGVPADRRVLSALGPRMLAIAAARSAGTHPYLTVPHQSTEAREALGPSAVVAPEQTVVLDPDAGSARATAREFLANYLRMVNYVSNMHRGGFTEDDTADGGSDRLVDAIVAHGDAGTVARGVRAHREAGADHVCVQVLPGAGDPLPTLRALAPVLGPAG